MTDYFYAGGGIGLGPSAPKPEVEPYPVPEVTSRDGVTGPTKKAVTDLVRLAESLGWTAQVTYARGHFPHATHGTPGAVKDSLAVRMVRGHVRAVAVYSGATAWSWDTMAVQGAGAWPSRYSTLGAFQEALV